MTAAVRSGVEDVDSWTAADAEAQARGRLDEVERALRQVREEIQAAEQSSPVAPERLTESAVDSPRQLALGFGSAGTVKQLGFEIARIVDVVEARFERTESANATQMAELRAEITQEMAELIEALATRIGDLEQRAAESAAQVHALAETLVGGQPSLSPGVLELPPGALADDWEPEAEAEPEPEPAVHESAERAVAVPDTSFAPAVDFTDPSAVSARASETEELDEWLDSRWPAEAERAGDLSDAPQEPEAAAESQDDLLEASWAPGETERGGDLSDIPPEPESAVTAESSEDWLDEGRETPEPEHREDPLDAPYRPELAAEAEDSWDPIVEPPHEPTPASGKRSMFGWLGFLSSKPSPRDA